MYLVYGSANGYYGRMTLLHALLFGIVEGISEFLPISSTAHLILTGQLLGLPQTEFLKTFEISIQLGAILSVVVLYWRSFLQSKEVLLRIAAAFVPTMVIGFALHSVIKNVFFESTTLILWSLLLGGIFLIVFEKSHEEKSSATDDIESITYKQAAVIGLFQSIAVIPGVSRAAATIVGGLLLGLKRKTIVDFSFLLAVPTMLAATALDLVKEGSAFSSADYGMLAVGFVTSFVVAILAIKWLLKFIKNHSFTAFGIYRVAIAILFFLYVSIVA